jgi:leucyl-tRNA synthetase
MPAGQRGADAANRFMTIVYNKRQQKDKRRYLRENSTVAEKILWPRLKNKQLGVRFRRQYGIGHYIADFCSPRQKLVIELDGGIHDDDEQIYYDSERSKNIVDLGFKVLRFKNEEIEKEIDYVIEKIKQCLI